MFIKIFIILFILFCYILYLANKGFIKNQYINCFIILLLLLLIITCKNILSNNLNIERFLVNGKIKLPKKEKFKLSASNTSLGGTSEHLELAYKLCQSNYDKLCQKYVTQYDGLRKTFHKLKDDYCKNNPSRCMELGL